MADGSALKTSMSPLVLILGAEINTTAYLPYDEIDWQSNAVRVKVRPLDNSDEVLLNQLSNSWNVIVAHRYKAALCRLVSKNSRFLANNNGQWELHLEIKRDDFTPTMEMSFAGTSADKLAEIRARRLLLNENPAKESHDINDITRELFIGGQETLVRIERSPFPKLWEAYRSKPQLFLDVAWINSVMQLLLGACVVEILKLELSLQDATLSVDFQGRRRKYYQNVPAYEIRVRGSMSLER